ncbi:MAG: tetratricopeptide repeat protein [Bacteroidales bacterium]|nr:tetratricopeptide repeat protein [Bacteroidales bacterium]
MNERLRFILVLIILSVPSFLKAQVNVENYMNRGRSSFKTNDFTQAIECFNVVIQNKQKPIEAYYLRGIVKYYLDDLNGAKLDLTKAIELHPYYAKAFQYRAVVYDRLKEYSKSLADYNMASELDPYNSELYMNRGVLKSHTGDFTGAIDDYTKAISLNNRFELAYINRALVWQRIDSLSLALADCDQVIRFNSYSFDAFLKRGAINSELKNYDDALKDFNYAIRLDDKKPLTYFQRAILHLERKDTLAALNDYNKVLELDPRNAITYFNRGILYSMTEQYDKAIDDYTTLSLINPKNVFSWYYRGTVYLMQKKYLQAISDFNEAIALYPEYVDAYQNRSYSNQQLGRNKEAAADRQKLIQLGELAEKDQHSDLTAKKDFFKEITDFDTDWTNIDANVLLGDHSTDPQQNFRPILIPASFSDIYIELKRKEIYSKDLHQFTDSSPFGLNTFVSIQNPNISSDTILNYIHLYDSIIDLSTEHQSKHLIHLGILHAMIKNYNSALLSFEQAKAIEPNNAFLWFCISSVRYDMLLEINDIYTESLSPEFGSMENKQQTLIQNQDFNTVIKELDRAISLNSSSPIYYYNRANIKNRSHQRFNAVFDYTMALVHHPELAEALFNRGLTYIFMGDETKGCQDMSKSGELGLKDAYPLIKKYCK